MTESYPQKVILQICACSFHFERQQVAATFWDVVLRPENIQMLPRIHIFQGTALNETDLSGISSLDGSGVGHGKASGYEIKALAEVALAPGFFQGVTL